ncbi:MAG: 5'/3'-nucleotidase SurE [Pseudonocardiales bacterium]|nr:5'/3'-nucleotidase SurE [Pseudonocardiales bacterium]
MRVLVTNDDGVEAPGIAALARAAAELGHEVVVAAPAEQSSGASASIISEGDAGTTPVRPVSVPGLPGLDTHAVSASPAHIVLAAVRGWLDPVPDLVLSGINHGANVGRVVLHSGTVGAALTAGVHGVRALAVSLDVALHSDDGVDRHWDTATGLLPRVLDLLLDLPAGTVLSLNVPDLAPDRVRELRSASLAPFGSVQTRVDASEGERWRIEEVESDEEADSGTDTALLAAGHPTLTALAPVREDPAVGLAEALDRRRQAAG